ncbi:DUF1194 domain-containing protein [Shimia sagamensis]|uniref:VWFA domain-containing protein n=1 Tax=Shimia sagamensis TaxID=1566352 RepID=A0ABY1NMM3_9RHOB|nr:DUF1194 domain-containing protein [Shimia sagamensis]SMP12920.1 Protein of unknown function [Shimia sagamensis]
MNFRFAFTTAFTVFSLCLSQAAQAQCRQALALGLDVSGSVDDAEYRMQINGLAAAFENASVAKALLQPGTPPVALSVFEWSGPDHQNLIVPWTDITSPSVLSDVTTTLRKTGRPKMDVSTGLGPAIAFGADLLQAQPACWRWTLDISGDGKANTGPLPRDILMSEQITVNALVIGPGSTRPSGESREETASLVAYFDAWVTRGPDAFVEVAYGFADYEAAMTRKLLRELEGLSLALVDTPLMNSITVQNRP